MSELEKQLMDAHRKHTRASTVASTSLYEKAADIYEDIRSVVQRHREQAAAEERERIVAYLRKHESIDWRWAANEIEAKEHLG
jgi:hypothetical protein